MKPYQVMPDLTPEEYEALKADIQANGVQIPIDVDEEGNILDGHHRARICQELGIDYLKNVRLGLTEEEKIEFALRINLNRRHLTREQRQELALKLRQWGWSYPRIGEALGVDHATVINDIKRTCENSQVNLPARTVGKDGKERPATRPQPITIPVFSQKQEEKVQEIIQAAKSGDEKAQKLVEALDKGQTTVHAAYKKLTAREPVEPPPLPEEKYDLIYADPPWRYEFSETNMRAVENQYPTMSLEEICSLDIQSITADNAILFLWATNPKLEEALQVIKSWGFVYRTNMVWVKDKIGMGYYARQKHELLLIAKKGNYPAPEESARPESVIFAPRAEHSKKPESVYELIEKMYPFAKKVELFARNKREGWSIWGAESGDL